MDLPSLCHPPSGHLCDLSKLSNPNLSNPASLSDPSDPLSFRSTSNTPQSSLTDIMDPDANTTKAPLANSPRPHVSPSPEPSEFSAEMSVLTIGIQSAPRDLKVPSVSLSTPGEHEHSAPSHLSGNSDKDSFKSVPESGDSVKSVSDWGSLTSAKLPEAVPFSAAKPGSPSLPAAQRSSVSNFKETIQDHNGTTEDHNGTTEDHNGTMEYHSGTIEDHVRTIENHSIEDHSGKLGSFVNDLKSLRKASLESLSNDSLEADQTLTSIRPPYPAFDIAHKKVSQSAADAFKKPLVAETDTSPSIVIRDASEPPVCAPSSPKVVGHLQSGIVDCTPESASSVYDSDQLLRRLPQVTSSGIYPTFLSCSDMTGADFPDFPKPPLSASAGISLSSSLTPISETLAKRASQMTSDLPEPTIELEGSQPIDLSLYRITDSPTSVSRSVLSVVSLAGSKKSTTDLLGPETVISLREKQRLQRPQRTRKKGRLSLNKDLPPIRPLLSTKPHSPIDQSRAVCAEGEAAASAETKIFVSSGSVMTTTVNQSVSSANGTYASQTKGAPASNTLLLPHTILDLSADGLLLDIPSPISKDSFRIQKKVLDVTDSTINPDDTLQEPPTPQTPVYSETSFDIDTYGDEDLIKSVSVSISEPPENSFSELQLNRPTLADSLDEEIPLFPQPILSNDSIESQHEAPEGSTHLSPGISTSESGPDSLLHTSSGSSTIPFPGELSKNQIKKLLNDKQREVPLRADLNIDVTLLKAQQKHSSPVSATRSLGEATELNACRFNDEKELKDAKGDRSQLVKSLLPENCKNDTKKGEKTAVEDSSTPPKRVLGKTRPTSFKIRSSLYDVVNTDFENEDFEMDLTSQPDTYKSLLDSHVSAIDEKRSPPLVLSKDRTGVAGNDDLKSHKVSSGVYFRKVFRLFSPELGSKLTPKLKKPSGSSQPAISSRVTSSAIDQKKNYKRNGLLNRLISNLKSTSELQKLKKPHLPEEMAQSNRDSLAIDLPTFEVENDTFDDLLQKFEEVEKDAELGLEAIVLKSKSLSDLFIKDDELTKDQIADQQRNDNHNSDDSLPQRVEENVSNESVNLSRKIYIWLEEEALNQIQSENLLTCFPKHATEQRFLLKAHDLWKTCQQDQSRSFPAFFKHVKQFLDYEEVEICVKDFDLSSRLDMPVKRSNSNIASILIKPENQKREPKRVNFANSICITETFAPYMYKRYNKSVTHYYLTESEQINRIKNELNAYKCHEMLVHEKSQGNTHFFY